MFRDKVFRVTINNQQQLESLQNLVEDYEVVIVNVKYVETQSISSKAL